jgi:predicted porin
MKKTLVAIAAIAAATGAMAQSTVTAYGILDAGYTDNSKNINGVKFGQQAVTFNNYTSSRIGFKGTEDIGGGTKANFVIESGLSANTITSANSFQPGVANVPGSAVSKASAAPTTTAQAAATTGATLDATTLGNRELNASLQFASGTIIGVGYGSTGIRDTVLAYDAAGGINALGNILTNDAQLSSNRATAVAIRQPLVKGLVGSFGMARQGMDKTAANDTNGSTGYMAALKYDNGPLSAAYAFQNVNSKTNEVAAVANTSTAVGGTTGSALVAATDKTVKTTVAGVSYQLSMAKLFAEYGAVKTDDAVTANVQGAGKRSGYSIGTQVPYGAATPFVQYSSGTKTESFWTGKDAVGRKYTGYSVGVNYALSKRTFAYGVVGRTKLADGGGTVADTGYEVKNTQTTFGLAHSF